MESHGFRMGGLGGIGVDLRVNSDFCWRLRLNHLVLRR
jgi:hypothetical protein